ncbi:hypothetical protein LOTGIDRAFT_115295, partial [Lottia gigantea]
ECGPGEHVKTPCSDTQGVTCEPCPRGTFSSSTNVAHNCAGCTYLECHQNAVIESECSSVSDKVCKCKPGYEEHTVTGDGPSCLRSYTSTTSAEGKSHDERCF